MRNRPAGSELLQVARETLLKELLPHLPGEQNYPALMVANAMGIAARENEAGDTDLSQELAMFAQLYGDIEKEGAQIATQLASLNARLVHDIRAGRFDGKSGERLRALLLQHVCTRLRISNPKYLKGAGLS